MEIVQDRLLSKTESPTGTPSGESTWMTCCPLMVWNPLPHTCCLALPNGHNDTYFTPVTTSSAINGHYPVLWFPCWIDPTVWKRLKAKLASFHLPCITECFLFVLCISHLCQPNGFTVWRLLKSPGVIYIGHLIARTMLRKPRFFQAPKNRHDGERHLCRGKRHLMNSASLIIEIWKRS